MGKGSFYFIKEMKRSFILGRNGKFILNYRNEGFRLFFVIFLNIFVMIVFKR